MFDGQYAAAARSAVAIPGSSARTISQGRRSWVVTVERPGDGDRTAALLEAIEQPGAAPVGLGSISSVHWSDGGVVDLDRVAPAGLAGSGRGTDRRCGPRRT